MGATFGVGVPGRWSTGGGLDLLPLLAGVAAVLGLRFVLGRRLTALNTALALLAGNAWAWAAEPWGVVVPTLLLLVAAWFVARPVVRRRG